LHDDVAFLEPEDVATMTAPRLSDCMRLEDHENRRQRHAVGVRDIVVPFDELRVHWPLEQRPPARLPLLVWAKLRVLAATSAGGM
jgi:hypothetical protein